MNSVTSSLNDSDEQISPGPPGSRGVQVANSHFSKIKANNGNNGWLKEEEEKMLSYLFFLPSFNCNYDQTNQDIDLSHL